MDETTLLYKIPYRYIDIGKMATDIPSLRNLKPFFIIL